jgi:hypothetical protein
MIEIRKENQILCGCRDPHIYIIDSNAYKIDQELSVVHQVKYQPIDIMFAQVVVVGCCL